MRDEEVLSAGRIFARCSKTGLEGAPEGFLRSPLVLDGDVNVSALNLLCAVPAATILVVAQNWKDSLEDASSALAQVAAGFVPGVGPLLAAAVPLVAGSAQLRRVERDLLALRADVEDAVRSGRISDMEAALTSETFLAGVQFTIQHMLESASEERRQRLRMRWWPAPQGKSVIRKRRFDSPTALRSITCECFTRCGGSASLPRASSSPSILGGFETP